jgi:hypothetical protein
MEAVSRFITAPDLDYGLSYRVLIVGATDDDIARITFFCKHSDIAVDIYLHDGNVENQGWLMNVVDQVEVILLRTSKQPSPVERLLMQNYKTIPFYEPELPVSTRFKTPLAFFEWYSENAGKSSS